jgi:hypothetical protein
MLLMKPILFLTALYAVAGFFVAVDAPEPVIVFTLGALVVLTGLTIGHIVQESQGRRREVPPAPETTDPRVTQLQSQLSAIAEEVERIGEGQRFITKILAERQEKAHRPALGSGSGQRNTPPH